MWPLVGIRIPIIKNASGSLRVLPPPPWECRHSLGIFRPTLKLLRFAERSQQETLAFLQPPRITVSRSPTQAAASVIDWWLGIAGTCARATWSKLGTILRFAVRTQDQFVPCAAAIATCFDVVLNKVDTAICEGDEDSIYVLTACACLTK